MFRLKHIWIGILLLLSLACEEDDVWSLDSITYEFSYPTEERPFSVSFKESNHTLYVANLNPSIDEYSAQIQVFNTEGALIKTLVDFEAFDLGRFERYEPLDIAFDKKQNLFVLARPLFKQGDDSWASPTGFSILRFDENDDYTEELDFSDIDGESRPTSLSYFDGSLYLTNGRILKQIDLESEQIINISLPVGNDNIWPYLHTTDMEIDANGVFYFTGQAALNNDSVGCHISSYQLESNELTQKYAKGWTWMCCAMMNNPGLFISKTGVLYLASFYQMSIEVYNENGDFLIDCDTRTSGFEETRPIDLVSYNSKIYVADHFNSQIHVFKQN